MSPPTGGNALGCISLPPMSGNIATEPPVTGKTDEEPMLYSVDRAAKKLGISTRATWDLVMTGQLPSKKVTPLIVRVPSD